MEEQRTYQVTDKIFTLADIKRMLKIFQRESDNAQKKKDSTLFEIKVSTFDGSSYTSSSDDLFKEDSLVMSKKIKSIAITYICTTKNQYVSLVLTHGYNSSFGNSLTVKGKDSVWVNGVFSKIVDVILSAKKQNTFVSKYYTVFIIIGAISFGVLWSELWNFIGFIISLFYHININHPPHWALLLSTFIYNNEILYIVALAFSNFITGLYPSTILVNRLLKLWPEIELQIGPDYKSEAEKRKFLYGFIMLIIIPLIIGYIFWLFPNH